MNQPIEPAILYAAINDLAERVEALEGRPLVVHTGDAVISADVQKAIREAHEQAIANARRLTDNDELR